MRVAGLVWSALVAVLACSSCDNGGSPDQCSKQCEPLYECGEIDGCDCGECPAGFECREGDEESGWDYGLPTQCIRPEDYDAVCQEVCQPFDCGNVHVASYPHNLCFCGDCEDYSACTGDPTEWDWPGVCLDIPARCLQSCSEAGQLCGDFDHMGYCNCGDCPEQGQVCVESKGGSPAWVCCQPDCTDKECGDDGCGGDCGIGDTGSLCDDENPCTADSCNETAFLCVHVPIPCPDSPRCPIASCDSVNFDTTAKAYEVVDNCVPKDLCHTAICQAGGVCSRTPIPCPEKGCSVGKCEPSTGECSYQPLPCELDSDCPEACATKPCEEPRCQAGTKTCGVGPRDCDDGIYCTADSCDEAMGCIHSDAACGPCFQDADCDISDICPTDFYCNEAHRCIFTPLPGEDDKCCMVHADCDDQEPSTRDYCQGSRCAYVIDPGCPCDGMGSCLDDGDICTTEICDCHCTHVPIPGCCTKPLDCVDGDASTSDSCDLDTNTCVHTKVGVGDADPCTRDFCAPATGETWFEPESCPEGQICDSITGLCR